MKFSERFGIAIMSAWGLFAVHQGVNALMKAHNWVGLDSSTWASWVQAVGSIAAIMASFFLFSRQREHEKQEGRDNELARRTRAVTAVQDVAYWAVEAMEECVKHKKGMRGIRPDSDLFQRLDELRELLNRFVDPAADRIIVIAAMSIGNALLQTKHDLPYPFMDRDDDGIARMTARNDELRLTHARLIRMQQVLEQKCVARGIELEPAVSG